MADFKAPQPFISEPYDQYFRRMVTAVEDHVNNITRAAVLFDRAQRETAA